MWKVAVAIAVLVAAGGITLAQFIQLPDRQEVVTRFGSLTIDNDRTLLFNGRKVTPAVVGNNSLDLGDPIRIGETDVVLVRDNGGTACPSLFYFVTVSKTGASATKAFGTCGDVTSVKRMGNSIQLITPGFRGPFEPEAAQLRAARQRHVFVYRAGLVTKNGRIVK